MENKRYFRIELYGYGGEAVIGTSTPEEFEYWQSKQALTDTGTEELEDALFTYLEEHEFESERFKVPDQFTREGTWYEQDDLAHENGVDFAYGHVNVYEVDGPDWEAKQIATVVEDVKIADFIENHNADSETNEFKTDEQYVFFGMSSDKGMFYSAVVETEGDIDLSLIKFYSTELPTDDDLVVAVTYNNEDLSNEGGDTTGKSITVKFIEL